MREKARTWLLGCAWLACAGLAGLIASGCVEGHEVPGTREGLLLDGGEAGGSGHGDGDGDGDGDMPDAAPPAPTCNPTECEGASSMFGTTPACCTADDRCGLDFSALGLTECLERNAPGPVDSACPGADLFGLISFPGCCARDSMCGLRIDSFLPLGCVSGDIDIPIPGLGGGAAMSCSTFTAPD